MTDLLDQAVQAARTLPDEMQDNIARMMLSLASIDQAVVQLTDEENASFAISLDQARNRMFASDAAVEAVWAKYGL